jgi:hypothetical protein
MSAPVSKPRHTISVRDLVEFVLRQGDLGGEREFVGSDRALAGIRGHQKIQRSRPTGYLTELPVEYRVEADEFTLQIRGRIDGLLITSQQVLLEEIKTVQGTWNHSADPTALGAGKILRIHPCTGTRLEGNQNSTRVSGIAHRQGNRVSPDIFICRTI